MKQLTNTSVYRYTHQDLQDRPWWVMPKKYILHEEGEDEVAELKIQYIMLSEELT